MNLYIDFETNMAHDTIWCCGVSEDGQNRRIVTEAAELAPLVQKADKVIAHNLVGFDAVIAKRLWGIIIPPAKMVDTLLLSRLLNPSMDNGHSLDAWGERMGFKKGTFRDYDAGLSAEMIDYCIRDIELLEKLHKTLVRELADEGFSEQCVNIEHSTAIIIREQEDNGVGFDLVKALMLRERVQARMAEIEQKFQILFPPRTVELYSVNTHKPLKVYQEVFNVGSRQQVVERLFELGVGNQLTDRTETGRYKLSETVLDTIDIPEAKLVVEYLTLQKRDGLLNQWIIACKPSGRIHGRVNTIGAVTGRMTHASPNMAQVPAGGSYMGKECRELFVPAYGKVLVGADASALELCMLAHYMRDDGFTDSVVSGDKDKGTDVHTRNKVAAGLDTRDQAKTFIYALLYGAGPGKIGQIVNGGFKEGAAMIDRFMANMPKLRKLIDKVQRMSVAGKLPGLDGRMIRVRSQHSALNTLLQGAGAIVMKKALIVLYKRLRKEGIEALFVLNVHDEWQIECAPEVAETVGKYAVEAIRDAGVALGCRCPLSGEYKIGKSWAETH